VTVKLKSWRISPRIETTLPMGHLRQGRLGARCCILEARQAEGITG